MVKVDKTTLVLVELLVIFGVFFIFQFVSNIYMSKHSNEAVWVGKMDWRLRSLAMAFFSLVAVYMLIFQYFNTTSDTLAFTNIKISFLILVMMYVSPDVVTVAFDAAAVTYVVLYGIKPYVLAYIVSYAILFALIMVIGYGRNIKPWWRLLLYNLVGLIFWTATFIYAPYSSRYQLSVGQTGEYLIQMVILVSIPYIVTYFLQQNQQVIFKQTQEAFIDGLTQVLNYHAFNLNVEHAFQRAKEKDLSLCMMILDLDHFKSINDTYGHLAGNYILIHFCQIISQMISKNVDIALYRIGGEEFALVFNETEPGSAAAVGQRMLNVIRDEDFIYKGQEIDLTFSAGISKVHPDNYTSKEFFDQVDQLTYQAKKAGGNQIRTDF